MLKHNKEAGFTLVELIVVVVCAGILAFITLPKFIDISTDSEIAAELDMAGNVRTGLQLHRAEEMINTGSGNYPSALDDAETGPSSHSNPFFANILQNPYTGNGWHKESHVRYTGPAGGIYIYNSFDGTFTKVEE